MNSPTRMLPQDLQLTNEYRFSRKHIDGYLRKAILDNPEMVGRIDQGVELLTQWMSQEYYASKQARLRHLENMSLTDLVTDIFVGVAYCQTPELFVSVTSQLATRLNFDDHRDSIMTIAEMVAVLCNTDAFDIVQPEVGASMLVQSRIPLPKELLQAVERSQYLPPMVCEPDPVQSNYESPYLSHNDCLVLGKGNGHAGDLCLDVINTQNSVALSLDARLLKAVEEVPTFAIDSAEKGRLWDQFMRNGWEVYQMLLSQGNRFWLTNKVDKRGRLYSQGYHVTTQGTSYKKAMVVLADKEVVDGVPQR